MVQRSMSGGGPAQDIGIARRPGALVSKDKKTLALSGKRRIIRPVFEVKLYAVPVRPYAVLQPKHQHGR
jgi:hypothetical protein